MVIFCQCNTLIYVARDIIFVIHSIHAIERRAMPEYFNGKNKSKTPEMWVEYHLTLDVCFLINPRYLHNQIIEKSLWVLLFLLVQCILDYPNHDDRNVDYLGSFKWSSFGILLHWYCPLEIWNLPTTFWRYDLFVSYW